jgi:hypothetical protein
MSREFEYTVKKKITEEDLRDLIIDGIETGIGYWATLDNDTEEFDRYYETTDFATSEIVADILLKGGSVKITDVEDEENPKYELTLERLLIGIQKNAEERPHDCDLENYDAVTADCIFQYALYDEIIFG